jgi:hypothetical protein
MIWDSPTISPMGRAAIEVGCCADLEPRRRVIPPAPTPSLEEYMASLPSLEESVAELIAEAVRMKEKWERDGPEWVRAKA